MVEKNLIYKCIHGSTAYGLNTPSSDIDIKGIFIPNKEYYFGMKHIDEQINGSDEVIYALKKFVTLARDCNPNIIEVLFCDDKDIQFISIYGQLLRDNRNLFISKKAKFTFSGYAMAQMLRIKNHRKWIMNPQVMPDQKDFFKPKEMNVNGEIVKYTKFMEAEYDAALKKYNQYNDWLKNRHPERAQMEREFGFDGKHGMHLMRLLRMGKEILEGKGVIVKRPDREELLGIRQGKWSYDKLIEEAEKIDTELNDLYETSTLRHSPDDKSIDDLLIKITEQFFQNGI